MARPPLPARLTLLGTLALAIACGDDGDTSNTAASTAAGSTTSDAASTTAAAEAESTGTPAECDAVACGEGELCVVPCTPDPPFCTAANTVLCDFGTAICTLEDVCSGPLQGGALVCEPCDG